MQARIFCQHSLHSKDHNHGPHRLTTLTSRLVRKTFEIKVVVSKISVFKIMYAYAGLLYSRFLHGCKSFEWTCLLKFHLDSLSKNY